MQTSQKQLVHDKFGAMRPAIEEMARVGIPLAEAVQHFERAFIDASLQQHLMKNGQPNQCAAARDMGMHRNTLSRKLNVELRHKAKCKSASGEPKFKPLTNGAASHSLAAGD